ncbi:hypothetical protein B1R94_09710 [Mycolicibacterium litorale]|nr:hypothetical protein B1R94_09710 [Mycolicibacterium litorale]
MKRLKPLPVTAMAAAITAAVVGSASPMSMSMSMSAAPHLTAAQVDYLRGTNIGWTPTDAQYRAFVARMIEGTGTAADPPTSVGHVPYNAGFWPISHGLLADLRWDASVAQGVHNLSQRDPSGNVVFGLSQGAAVVSAYKAAHPEGTGNTFLLVVNPNRPNGGVLARFAGAHIPILDITFNGATPDNGDTTIDIARQYDGWSDFPTYPLNILATVNAVLGMLYVHGQTQTGLTAADLEATRDSGDTRYYQQHGATTYYLIRTDRLPLLMPLSGIVPDPILDAVDPVLRAFIELGYDRTDYSQPTPALLFPRAAPPTPGRAAERRVAAPKVRSPQRALRPARPAATAAQTSTTPAATPQASRTPRRPAGPDPTSRGKAAAGSSRAAVRSLRGS